MSRPRNNIRCPECALAGRPGDDCRVLRTEPDVGSGKTRTYLCNDCGTLVHTHEAVIRHTPPVPLDAPRMQKAP